MVETSAKRAPHVFIFEPRIEGHHLSYLKVITDELLDAGYRLTLAVDKTPEAYAVIRAEMSCSLERVSVIPAKDGANGGSNLVRRIATLFEELKADLVFLPNLDEVGSVMLRSAALGLMPPSKAAWAAGRDLSPTALSRGSRDIAKSAVQVRWI